MLAFHDLTYRIQGRVLIEDANATISAGQRVGLVGRNGTGKSTLLRLIVGEVQAEQGGVDLPERARVARLPQEPPTGAMSPLSYTLAADTERAALLAEEEANPAPERIAAIHERLNEIQAHSAPARAAAILSGLGFDAGMQDKPLDAYSGGWRMRAALAAALFSEPDLLLLDEPTNHLDLEAALWLEEFLNRYPRTLLLVSHDRHFLNNVADHILHLDQKKLTLYRGNYDRFEAERRSRMERQASLAARQAEQRRHMEEFVARFRAKATKARQAQSRLKMLAKMQPIPALVEDPEIVFRLPQPEELPPPIITMEGAAVGYQPGQPILRKLSLRVDMDDRIALLGANGNGKTTLARLLSGALEPQSGSLWRHGKLRIGYFAQDQAEIIEPDTTPFVQLGRLMKTARPDEVRGRLGGFGLSQERADTPAGQLSGGEKARLLFALITHAKPHLLILDEPTNHLDMDTRDALVQALNDFSGAVVLVSHDRHLAEACADRFWLVADGTVTPFDGDLDDYAKLIGERRRAANAGRKDKESAAKPDAKAERRQAADLRAAVAPLRKKAKAAETRLEKLNAEQARMDEQLADPATYTRLSLAAQNELRRQHAVLLKAIAAAEDEWLAAQTALEEAQAQ